MLTIGEIKQFIQEDASSISKIKAREGQRYYEAEHDIRDYRLFYFDADGILREDKTRTNIKISHPFFLILSDQLSAYMLSFEDNPIRAKKNVEGLQEHLDKYFDEEFWSEIGELITGAYNKGFEYLYSYINEDGRTTFECADSLGVADIQGKYAKDGQDHIIYHYLDTDLSEKGKRLVRKIQDWTETETYFYVQDSESNDIVLDDTVPINPRPHVVYEDGEIGEAFGYIPFWRLDNNKRQISGLKPIKELIDDYDIHACSLSNNLIDFDNPLYVVKGFEGDNLEQLQRNLKTKRLIGLDEDGGVDVKTIDIPYEARKAKLEVDKESIFTFGMGFDPTQVGDGNITNIVIKSRYALLDLKANKLEKRLKKLLKKIVKTVLQEINTINNTDFLPEQVECVFERSIMMNESENIANEKVKADTKQVEVNTILNVAAQIGDEKAIQLICECLDIDYEEIKGELEKRQQEEQQLQQAQTALDNVVIDNEEVREGNNAIVPGQ